MRRPTPRGWVLGGVALLALALACARTIQKPSPLPPLPPAEEVGAGAGAAAEPGAAEGARGTETEPPGGSGPASRRPESVATTPVPGPEVTERLRVGLATDLDVVRFPGSQELVAEAGGLRLALAGPFEVRPESGGVAPPDFRVQIAALKDQSQAEALARWAGEQMGTEAEALFDAGTGFYRVRVGRFATPAQAAAARERLADLGFPDAWLVKEPGLSGARGLRIRAAERESSVPGRWLVLRPAAGAGAPEAGIAVESGRYRGRILVYLNDRGTLNLINDVTLEDYLRGVVPREMGPGQYDEVEALKAQAVAARTYTLRNLSEFGVEGYDICATPRCQVYGGMRSEHPLTDQAIAATAGEVMVYDGELVDALYSATCGGHTEDVGTVFPGRHEPYLRGVPCVEAPAVDLRGLGPSGIAEASAIVAKLLGEAGTVTAASAAERLRRLAILAGLPGQNRALPSLAGRDVQSFVADLFDLGLEARLFVAHEEVRYLVDDVPADWSVEDARLGAFLVKSGLLERPSPEALSLRDLEDLMLGLAERFAVVRRQEGAFLGLEDGRIAVRVAGAAQRYELPEDLTTVRQLGGRAMTGSLHLLVGDAVTLWLQGAHLLAVTQHVDPRGAEFDRTGSLSSWSRFRSDRELAELVRGRYPDVELEGLEVLARGVSGRVAKLRLLNRGGPPIDVEGLAVRWTLDLPDTLFTVRHLAPPDREPGWLFSGRGWGHGVGMCQVGAYGMALRGRSYRDILRHYYTGVELARVRLRPAN